MLFKQCYLKKNKSLPCIYIHEDDIQILLQRIYFNFMIITYFLYLFQKPEYHKHYNNIHKNNNSY